jgi:predicted patatin/cPLA2 family phospholipase
VKTVFDITPLQLLELRRADSTDRTHRRDQAHLALVLEGGGMRGIVSVAMAAALDQEGYYDAFDSVHGSSAGACGGAYFAARQAALGTTVYYEDINNKHFIDLLRWARGRPIMDTDFLINDVMRKRKPLNVKSIIDSPGLMNVVLTDIDAHKSHSISAFPNDDDFFSILKGSICLPLIAGYQVRARCARYFDGGISQHFAVDSAVAAGATHIILLMTRPVDQLVRPVGRSVLSFDGLALRFAYGVKIKAMFDQRNKTINETVASVKTGYLGPQVRIFGIARATGATVVERLTTNEMLLRAAAKEAREAVLQSLARRTVIR